MLRRGRALLAVVFLVASCFGASAQSSGNPPQQSDQSLLKPEQLEALVAPIALYPDPLLANVLAASSYPLEIVQADRWLSEHKNLKGEQLKAEVDKQAWDDSVKALVSTPSVLATMSQKIDWTKNLGDAVLAQQPDVMDAIQRLRSRAYANKKLTPTKQQKVAVQQQDGKQVIVIEPTVPDTMYVPYYDPAVVYGEWPYASYPPYYFGYPPYIGSGIIAAGIGFGAAYLVGRWWGNYWGGRFNWGNNNFFVNRANTINGWRHNPAHRQGVRYASANVAQRFGNNNLRAGSGQRMDFRGRGGQQVLRPSQNRAGAADRGRANRAGTRERASAANRARSNQRTRGNQRVNNRAGQARSANRSGGGARGGRDSAFRNIQSGRAANQQSARGRQSFASARASMGGGLRGGGFRGAGGGGFRGGGGGFRGGGGRRSDLFLKHDIVPLGHLQDGLGYYRFSYIGSNKAYVGVIAQQVQTLMPQAVTRGPDGYLRVDYHRLGLKFQTYRHWRATGGHVPTGPRMEQ